LPVIYANAQTRPPINRSGIGNNAFSQMSGLGNRSLGTGKTDSLQRRNNLEDSITIWYRFLDLTFHQKIDSSIIDFTSRFPVPATNVSLGNLGSASRSVLFSPNMKAGWNQGQHAFDIYKWRTENGWFLNTTRPYTELGYLVGTRTEQLIEVLHTQNVKPNWNILFKYRFINSPGVFKNLQTNHNNYNISSWYQSKDLRYNNFFMLVSNNLEASENGGIKTDQDYLNNPIYEKRFSIPTKIGGDDAFGRDFFSAKINTGNFHKDVSFLMRQQYDLGKKDSLIVDSLKIPLFYPRLRFEHTVNYHTYNNRFSDFKAGNYYRDFYNINISGTSDTVSLNDQWKELKNDFSIYQFPNSKNLNQYFKVGATLQNLKGEFSNGNTSVYNVSLHGSYRNKTRNQKWDLDLSGELFAAGNNSGDYYAGLNLKRQIGKKSPDYAGLGFENVNRTPSFIFDQRSSFYLDAAKSFQKENTTHLFGEIYQSKYKLKIAGHYYLMSNYSYIRDFYKLEQESALFNLVQVAVQKIIPISRYWNWYADIYLQQKTGNSPVNVPLLFTRNRIAFEGVFFKNLDISTGLEARYHTAYKADNYSPVLGQFFYQDSIRINNRTPDVSAFLHFRIRSFKSFIRVENLNTVSFSDGLKFTNNNFSVPGYPLPGMLFRLGIWWSFVN
jgi:hypothetical protein